MDTEPRTIAGNAPNAHINMSGLCSVREYASNGDTLYVLENPLSMVNGQFPFIIQLADENEPRFYLVFGNVLLDHSNKSWRRCVETPSLAHVVYGPYPDYNTAAITYMLVHESAVKQIHAALMSNNEQA